MIKIVPSLVFVVLRFCCVSLSIGLAASAAGTEAAGVRVEAVAMAAPDIVRLDLVDPPFARGRLVALDAPREEAPGTWVEAGEGGWGLVVGPERDHLRLADAPPHRFLDRAAIDDPTAYAPIGGRRVVAVFRKSMPYDSGLFRAENGDSRSGASFRHLVYLQLDGALPEGTHAIAGPADLPAGTRIDFDDGATRAAAIHATQLGHRAGDKAKIAFLSLWLPGGPDEGAVDFRRYGISRFEVIDTEGRAVFEGEVRLRARPDSPEPGNGLPAELVEAMNAGQPPLSIRDLEPDGRLRTREPHRFFDGERVVLQRLGGEEDAGARFATVSDPDETSFALADLDGPLPDRASIDATVAAAHASNRAGTFVFELDYSAWVPEAEGTYRLRIAGLGVSDPFAIADDVWLRSARNSIAGLYHHRSGIALDGRFGYERPAGFRPGRDVRVLRSRLPLAWSSEFSGGFVPFAQGAAAPWITEDEAPLDAWGGYMDAGDWDRRIQHVEVASLLLEAEEVLAEKRMDPDLGVPRSSAVLPDPAYRGADGLPDLVHEAIWGLDFFRRLQVPDGGIPGGIESAGHPLSGEPSFLEHQAVFLYAPDPLATYRYAAVAAKLARILRAEKQRSLADLFEASALKAWRWAEAGFDDPDAAYADALAAGTQAGVVDAAAWPARREALQAQAAEYRVAAAAALFRLTGERSYGALFEAAWAGGWDLYAHKGDAAWDYLRAKRHDPAVGAAIERMIESEASLVVSAQAGLSYPAMKHPFAPAGWGQGGAPDYGATMLLMRAHRLTGDPAIVETMERAHHAVLGANQLGLSLTTGLGARQVSGVLHVDSLAMGVPPPAGITVYGWAPQASWAFGWIFGPPWSPLPELGTEENAAARRIEPPRFALPYFEYLVEHPAVVIQMEYTVQQTIAPMAALALYLAANR